VSSTVGTVTFLVYRESSEFRCRHSDVPSRGLHRPRPGPGRTDNARVRAWFR
jgi:hypothetical protein